MSQIRPYLKLLQKNWWLIVVLSATGYAAGRIIHSHRQLDIYAASAEILLDQGGEALDYQKATNKSNEVLQLQQFRSQRPTANFEVV